MKPTPTALNGSRSVNARLADVEPTVEALLSRCDELLLAGKDLAGRVAVLAQQVKMLEEYTVAFHRKLVTPWQRLVWVIRG